MNTRICSVVAAVTLLTVTSGCGGMRNFLFGRGARCGTCNQFTGPSQTPPPQPPCGQTPRNPVPTEPGCGYEAYRGNCNLCEPRLGSAYGPCECGGTYTDPYLSGGAITYEGQAIGNGTVLPDNWRARRYDEHGDLIIHEGPAVPAAEN